MVLVVRCHKEEEQVSQHHRRQASSKPTAYMLAHLFVIVAAFAM